MAFTKKPKGTIFKRIRAAICRWVKKRRNAKPVRDTRPIKKPVIYLFSPDNVDVSVAVTLAPELRFTTIYPIVPIQLRPVGHKIEWNVQTQADGTLTELDTGLELSSLFWEADINSTHQTEQSRTAELTTIKDPDEFNLSHCDLCDMDSVVLSFNEVTRYLERALTALGLHVEARTSFITFWLPSFQKHSYIALRFIPQSAYSRIAPLEITPKPDVIIRIFMVFKGVSDVGLWPSAQVRARKDVSFWASIVGVDMAAAWDDELFRVLEWGAMEVSL